MESRKSDLTPENVAAINDKRARIVEINAEMDKLAAERKAIDARLEALGEEDRQLSGELHKLIYK